MSLTMLCICMHGLNPAQPCSPLLPTRKLCSVVRLPFHSDSAPAPPRSCSEPDAPIQRILCMRMRASVGCSCGQSRCVWQVDGVADVHDLHVWALTPGIPLLAAHLAITPSANPAKVLDDATAFCQSRWVLHSESLSCSHPLSALAFLMRADKQSCG